MNVIVYYIAVVLFILLVVFLLILRYKNVKEKQEQDRKALEVLDKMGMRRAYINTKYIERELFECVEHLVYSYYSQSLQMLPTKYIMAELYNEYATKIKREIDVGVKKRIHEFQKVKMRVAKQDNSSHYIVSCLEVEGTFEIDYDYMHPTINKRIRKTITQKFIFLNVDDTWKLKAVSSENTENEVTTALVNL